MDAQQKRAPGPRGLVALAYSSGSNRPQRPYRKYGEGQSLPGPLFDAFVIGTFIVLVVGYYS
jgi:hypothetical protein